MIITFSKPHCKPHQCIKRTSKKNAHAGEKKAIHIRRSFWPETDMSSTDSKHGTNSKLEPSCLLATCNHVMYGYRLTDYLPKKTRKQIKDVIILWFWYVAFFFSIRQIQVIDDSKITQSTAVDKLLILTDKSSFCTTILIDYVVLQWANWL